MSARQPSATDLLENEAAAQRLPGSAHAAEHQLVQDSAQILQDGELVH